MSVMGNNSLRVSQNFYLSNFIYLSILIPINLMLYSKGFYPYTFVLGLLINGLVIWLSSFSWLHSLKLKGTDIEVSKFGKSDQFNYSNIKSIKRAPYGIKSFWKPVVLVDLLYESGINKSGKVRFAAKNKRVLRSFVNKVKMENQHVFVGNDLYN